MREQQSTISTNKTAICEICGQSFFLPRNYYLWPTQLLSSKQTFATVGNRRFLSIFTLNGLGGSAKQNTALLGAAWRHVFEKTPKLNARCSEMEERPICGKKLVYFRSCNVLISCPHELRPNVFPTFPNVFHFVCGLNGERHKQIALKVLQTVPFSLHNPPRYPRTARSPRTTC